MIAGIRLFGLTARNYGLNWSPLPMLIQRTLQAMSHFSSMVEIFQPLGVGR